MRSFTILFAILAFLSFTAAQKAFITYTYSGNNCDNSRITSASYYLLTRCGNNGTVSASAVKNGNNVTLSAYNGVSCSGNPVVEPFSIEAYSCRGGVGKAVFADSLEVAPTSNDTVTYNYYGKSCSGGVVSGYVIYGTQCSTTAKLGCVVDEGYGNQILCGNGSNSLPSNPSTQVLVNFAVLLIAAIFAL